MAEGDPPVEAKAGPSAPARRARKLRAWEVDHPLAPPAPVPPKLPRWMRPFWRFYAYTVATPARRNFYVKTARIVLILGMVGLATALILPELTNASAPSASPLTWTGTIEVGPNQFRAVSNWVDGDDVIAGNYTVIHPPGAPVTFKVALNGTSNTNATFASPLWTQPGEPSAATFDFTAAYTDWYSFVWTNPSNFTISIYVSMNYLSSAPPA